MYEPFGRFNCPGVVNLRVSNIKDIKEASEIIARELIHLLIYNTKRVHKAFQNERSPVQFMLSIPIPQLILKMPQESRTGWHYTGG